MQGWRLAGWRSRTGGRLPSARSLSAAGGPLFLSVWQAARWGLHVWSARASSTGSQTGGRRAGDPPAAGAGVARQTAVNGRAGLRVCGRCSPLMRKPSLAPGLAGGSLGAGQALPWALSPCRFGRGCLRACLPLPAVLPVVGATCLCRRPCRRQLEKPVLPLSDSLSGPLPPLSGVGLLAEAGRDQREAAEYALRQGRLGWALQMGLRQGRVVF